MCATKSVKTVVWDGMRSPRRLSSDSDATGVGCTDTTWSGGSARSSAASLRVPRRLSPISSGEDTLNWSPSQ